MNKVTKLHHEAMDLAEAAAVAQRQGDFEHAAQLNRQAFEKEKQAANAVANRDDLEPTRSILHRSAASLALICKETREAERLIAHALSVDPPEEIADELRDLLEEVYFERHLKLRETVLQHNEVQLSFAGKVVGFGIAPSNQILPRIQNVQTLIRRTAERCANFDFTERGHHRKKYFRQFEPYLSTPRTASFAVTLRFATEQPYLPDMDPLTDVADDLLTCLDLLNRQNITALREKIHDEAYFHNFVELTKKIAPDGTKINLVGFTSSNKNKERTVALTTPLAQIKATTHDDTEEKTKQKVEILGTLLEANAKSKKKGRIVIVEPDGTKHKVLVKRGMMKDIVQPMFEENVTVSGVREGGLIHLENIDLTELDDS